MHGFLVIGKDKRQRTRQTQNEVARLGGKQVSYQFKNVSDARELRNILKIKVTEKMVYVLTNFDDASVEAQNAFLKTLEEPQTQVNFVLTATNEENVLPTIRSRCRIISTTAQPKTTQEMIKKTDDFVKINGGARMNVIAKLKTRSEAQEFLTHLILGGRMLMKKGKIKASFIEAALATLDNINRNGNVALQLTNFVVNLETREIVNRKTIG